MVRLVLAAESRVSVPFSLVQYGIAVQYCTTCPSSLFPLCRSESPPFSFSYSPYHVLLLLLLCSSSAFGISSCISTYTIRDSMM